MVNVTYDRQYKCWVARYATHIGEVGPVVYALTKEEAAFWLGVQYGRYPEQFTTPLEELMAAEKS